MDPLLGLLFLLFLLDDPPPPPPPIEEADLVTFAPMPWVVSCRWRWAFCRKVWSQRLHWKGRTSSCIRMCTTRL